MMGWLRIRPSPSPTSSTNSRAATLPRPPRPKRGSSSIADSLTSFDFRRKTYSESEVDAIDLVSLEPISPLRVSRSNSNSQLPQSQDVVIDHVTPPSSPPISIHEAPGSPPKTKNAIALFERKASGCLSIRLPTAEDTSTSSISRIYPSPTFTDAARAERELRKTTSIARPASVTSDSEDSMASLVSMLDDHNAPSDTVAEIRQCSTPVYHETDCLPNVNMLSPTWLHSRSSVRSSEQRSDSDGSLRALSPNVSKQDEPRDLQSISKTALHSRFARSNHSRSRTLSEKDLGEARPDSRNNLFHRPFSLSRRSQSRTSTEVNNTLAATVATLPCFMTSNDEFMNTPAVRGLRLASPGPGMGAFNDGSYSVSQSFSAPGEQLTPASTSLPLAGEEAPIVTQPPSPAPLGTRSPRPISSRSGLPLSSRSLSFTKAPATSAVSYFTRQPGMHISDMPPRSLVQIDETVPLPSPQQPPSAFPSPALPSPSYVDAMSFAWHEPRSGSPSSIGSAVSRRHSIARLPVKMDSAAHFPHSVSPSWDMRHQSVAGIICDPPISPVTSETMFRTRTPVTVDSAARIPRSATASPSGIATLFVDTPVSPLPMEPTFSSRSSSVVELEMPLYPMPIEPSFGRKRSNSKFEPHSDLPPISEVRQKSEVQTPQVEMPDVEFPSIEMPDAETFEEDRRLALGGDGHKSTGAVYDPPVSSPHMEDTALRREDIPTKHERKNKKEKKEVKKLKKKRPHEKTHKFVRYSRRFLLRRKVLNFLLGRQLGGAVADGLKAITCLPVGTDGLDLAVVAVPGAVTSPLHAGAVFPLAVVVGRHELESEEKARKLHFESSRSCVALTAPDLSDEHDEHKKGRRRSRHLSMDDLSTAIRHVDYAEGRGRKVRIE